MTDPNDLRYHVRRVDRDLVVPAEKLTGRQNLMQSMYVNGVPPDQRPTYQMVIVDWLRRQRQKLPWWSWILVRGLDWLTDEIMGEHDR